MILSFSAPSYLVLSRFILSQLHNIATLHFVHVCRSDLQVVTRALPSTSSPHPIPSSTVPLPTTISPKESTNHPSSTRPTEPPPTPLPAKQNQAAVGFAVTFGIAFLILFIVTGIQFWRRRRRRLGQTDNIPLFNMPYQNLTCDESSV